MSAKIVIDYIVEKQGINLNTLTDNDFSKFSWLNERESVTNAKGEKVSKSYYFENTKEAVRIEYSKIIGNHTHNGTTYNDVYLGFKKAMIWLDWAGEVAVKKEMQPYYFNLEPVFLGDGTETVIGFSSPKMRKSLKEERFAADDYLSSKSPELYAMLFAVYGKEYNRYLQTGVKTEFVQALEAETNPAILSVLNNEVYGYEPMTVKELIIMNLQ